MSLPVEFYAQVEHSMPIACVDLVPIREHRVGLIRRESPFGRVWCHVGGRVLRGETLAGALRRHALESLSVEIELPPDPQPGYVYQWFPQDLMPRDGMRYGDDPRKHAVALSYLVEVLGDPVAQNEALEFGWFTPGALPSPLWPGVASLLERLLSRPEESTSAKSRPGQLHQP